MVTWSAHRGWNAQISRNVSVANDAREKSVGTDDLVRVGCPEMGRGNAKDFKHDRPTPGVRLSKTRA